MARLSWSSIARGACVGLAIVVPVTVLRVVLDHAVSGFRQTAWVAPFAVAIVVAYAAAGWWAARLSPSMPLSDGMLAALGTLVLWIPIRIVIWALREHDRALLGGGHAVFGAGQLFGQAVLAAACGLVGALLGARMGAVASRPGGRVRTPSPSGNAPAAVIRPRNVRTPQGRVLGNTQSG